MQPVVLASFISAFVSLLGVIVSIYLSRRTTRQALDQTRLSAALRLKEGSLLAVKRFAAAIERARIACWQIRRVGNFSSLGGVTHQTIRRFIETSGAEITQAFEALDETWRSVDEAWADAKSDIPSGIVEYIRHMRHTAQADFLHLKHALVDLRFDQQNLSQSELSAVVLKIDQSAVSMLEHLEHLFQAVSSAIWSTLDEVGGVVPRSRKRRRDRGRT